MLFLSVVSELFGRVISSLNAQELSERLAPFGGAAFSVHPGVIATNLWREEQGPALLNRLGFLSLNKLLPKLIADKR